MDSFLLYILHLKFKYLVGDKKPSILLSNKVYVNRFVYFFNYFKSNIKLIRN